MSENQWWETVRMRDAAADVEVAMASEAELSDYDKAREAFIGLSTEDQRKLHRWAHHTYAHCRMT